MFFSKLFSPKKGQEGLAGFWSDEQVFLQALSKFKTTDIVDYQVITPYPVHDLEEVLGISRSWIPWVTFVFGVCGLTFGLWFTWWASAKSWPIIIGGKPLWSLAAFMPVIFELTILFAALSSILAFFLACGLPKIDPPIIDKTLSCSRFALFLPKKQTELEKLKLVLKDLQPEEIREAEF